MGAVLLELLTGGWNLVRMGFSALGKFLGSLNAQGVVGLIVALALAGLWMHTAGEARHWKKQSDQYEKLYNAERTADAKLAAHAKALKDQTDSQSAVIAAKNKELNDAQKASIAADAAAVRLRGPGKAACPHSAQLAAAAGGRGETPSTTQTSGPQVSSGDWAAVPWDWLVSVVEEHDQLLSEDQTWRNNDHQQRQAWPKGKP